uniref:G_PROTEIN_RECEP_F1_2 domain-containing protein n=1 Tax=Haemonchus contortus TaxID=6289 RepID=A0A7I4YPD0_HAECO
MENNTAVVDYNIHRIVIFTGVVIFTVFGLYGNISLIVIHIRNSKLRSKYGLLLSLLSFCQSLCLIFEWIGGAYILSSHNGIRSTCLKLIAGYVFVHCMQTGLMATIAIDLFVSIAFPLWHRVRNNEIYVILVSLPSALYGLLSVIFGFIMTNDQPINMCNPPSSLNEKVKKYWYIVAFICGGVTICGYILAYLILLYYSKRHMDQDFARRTMRSMSILLLIFLCTRYLATVGANVLSMAHVDPYTEELFQNYCVFAAMICYSQNFYVTLWRSSEYREVLWKQHMKVHNSLCGKCCPLTMKRKVLSESTPDHRHGPEHISMTHI